MKEEGLQWEVSSPNKRDFVARFTNQYRPPKEALDHFASIRWTNDWITNPAYELIPFWSRHLKSSGEDYFFSKTINTENTVPHLVTLQLRGLTTPEVALPDTTAHTGKGGSSGALAPVNTKVPDQVVLIQLGDQGVDGHPKVIHGGVTCSLLDEIMSLLITQHRMQVQEPEPWGNLFTANLNVNFRAPIQTPGPVVVKTWLVRRDRRKWLTTGQIEDEHGRILADARAIWVVAREVKI